MACLQADIDPSIFCNFDRYTCAFHGLEPFGLNSHLVNSGREIWSRIEAGLVRGQGAGCAALNIGDSDGGATYRSSARVGDGSQYPAIVGLLSSDLWYGGWTDLDL